MIKVYNLSKNIKEIKSDFHNFNDIPENVQNLILQGNHYMIRGIELLVYDNRQLICSCTVQEYKEKKYIMDCWTKEENLFNYKNIYEE